MTTYKDGKAESQNQAKDSFLEKLRSGAISYYFLFPGVMFLLILFGWYLIWHESQKARGIHTEIWGVYLSIGLVTLVTLALLIVWKHERRQQIKAESERKRLLLIEQEQRLLAETLAQAFLALTSQTDQTKVLDEILNQVQHIVAYDAANIVLIEAGEMHLTRWRGYKPADDQELISSSLQPLTGFPLDAEVVQSCQAVVITDVTLDSRWVTTSTPAWIHSFMAVPISLHERVIGLLRLDSGTPHRFSPEDSDRLKPLAHAAAIALENARLYKQLQQELLERTQAEQRVRELNSYLLAVQFIGAAIASSLDLNYILSTLTTEVINLSGVERCVIYEWAETTEALSIIARAEINEGQVVKKLEKSYHLADFSLHKSVLTQRCAQQLSLSQPPPSPAEWAYLEANRLKMMLLLPMEAQSEAIGLLELADSKVDHIFSIDQIALIQQLANQTASAIKNARLYSEANRRLEEQTALQEAITLISSTLDLTTVLNHIVEQMGRIVDATSAYICSYEPATMTSTVLAEYFGPRTMAAEKLSDLGVTYPLPRDFTRNFEHLLEGEPELIHLDEAGLDETRKNHMIRYGAQTLLNIPLRVRSQTIAFAELWESQQKRTFTPEEMALFQSIAQQAAVALENANLYERATQELVERRKIEKELRESEIKFRTLAETTAAAIFIYQQDRIRYVNPAAEAITGYTQPELLAMNFWEFIHPDFREQVKERGSARLKGKTIPPKYELKILTKALEERWLEVTLGVISFEDEVAVLGTAFDVTGRKQAEESLRKSEANLRAIFENSRQAFILIDKDYRILAFNTVADRGIKLTSGHELKEGNSIYDHIDREGVEEFGRDLGRVWQGHSVSLERNYRINNQEIWQELHYNPVFADDGQIIGICFSGVNITERKKLIETLAENENRLLAEIQGVLAIAHALVTETNLNTLLEFIMIQAKYITQGDGAAVLLLGEDNERFEAVVLGKEHPWFEINPSPEVGLQIQSNLQLPLKGSLAEQTLTTHTIQISHEVANDKIISSLERLVDQKPVQTLVCAPLVIQGKNLGVLLIWFVREQLFDEHDNRMMMLFANQAALALNNAHLYALNRQLAIEQERQRLARDLHDSVTQTLYSIGMAAETILRRMERKPKQDLSEPALHIHQLAQVALRELREQVHHLHPTAFTHTTLAELVDAYCNLLHQQHALVIKQVIDPDLTLSPYQRENLYYLIREALWNVVKYAPQAEIHLVITQAANQLTLSIEDNGPGFVIAAAAETEMYGLRSMRQRAALLGGSFTLESKPGEGTHIIAQIPLN